MPASYSIGEHFEQFVQDQQGIDGGGNRPADKVFEEVRVRIGKIASRKTAG